MLGIENQTKIFRYRYQSPFPWKRSMLLIFDGIVPSLKLDHLSAMYRFVRC